MSLYPTLERVSPHLFWDELACHDETRTPYPVEWRRDRAVILAEEFEALRDLGGGLPLLVASGFRTPAWNRYVRGALHSQHIEGRALDLMPVAPLTVMELYRLARARAKTSGSALRGLGLYKHWVHIDTRPASQLVAWAGPGVADTRGMDRDT